MIYFLRRNDGLIKIGTTTNYRIRLSQLIAEHGDLELLGIMEGERDVEQRLHEVFADNRQHKEWFKPSDALSRFIEDSTHLNLPPVANTVTIKIKPETKALMEIYGADITAETGSSPTNDEIIMNALSKLLPPERVEEVVSKGKVRFDKEKKS